MAKRGRFFDWLSTWKKTHFNRLAHKSPRRKSGKSRYKIEALEERVLLSGAPITVSIADAQAVEGGNLEFEILLSNPVDVDTVISYTTANGTATSVDNDYIAQANQALTIPAGETSGTIIVATTNDNKVELNETLSIVQVSATALGKEISFAINSVQTTVNFDDGLGHDVPILSNFYDAIGISVSNGVWHTANSKLSEGVFGLGVDEGVVSGTDSYAFPGTTSPIVIDFANPTTSVSIQAFGVGNNGAQIEAFDSQGNTIAVASAVGSGLGGGNNPILNVEGSGISRIELTQHLYSAASADGLSWDNLSFVLSDVPTGTILNDDAAVVSIADAQVVEGDDLEFAVTLSKAVDVDTIITYSTADDTATTADSDYAGQSNETLMIAAGQTSGTITVATRDDNKVELDEELVVNLGSADAQGRDLNVDVFAANRVAFWSGENNAEDSVGGHDGVVTGATFDTGINGGQAFNFHGNSGYVTIDNAPELHSPEITVESWIYLEPGVFNSVVSYFLSHGGHNNPTAGWSIGIIGTYDSPIPGDPSPNDTGKIFVFDGQGPADGAGHIVGSSEPLPLQTWTHVAFMNDGTTTKLYINGELVATGAQTFPTPTAPINIGRRADGAWTFDGKVDEVGLYNRVLTDAEIQQRFSGAGLGQATGTILNDDTATWSISGESTVNEGDSASYTVSLSNAFGPGLDASIDISLSDVDTGAADYSDFAAAVASAVGGYSGSGTVVFDGVDTLTFTATNDADAMADLVISLDALADGLVEVDEDYTVSLTNPNSNTGADITLNTALPAGLLASWEFDSGDISGASVAATGGTAANTTGTLQDDAMIVGGALDLDGAGDYLQFGNDVTDLRGLPAMTVSTWVNTASVNSGFRRIVEHEDNFYLWEHNGDSFNYATHGSPSWVVSSTAPAVGTWQHILAVYHGNGQPADIYVNGVFEASSASSQIAMANNAQTLQIGARRSGSGPASNFWHGLIDDVGIWDVALSESEINALAGAGNGGYSGRLTPTEIGTRANIVTTTITNGDSATVSIGDAQVVEGGNLEFAVTLSHPVDADTVITYSTSNGTATTADNDYTAQTEQILTIAAGQTMGTIILESTDDGIIELDETLSVVLSGVSASGRNVTIDDGAGSGIIQNNDSATVSIADAQIVEGGNLEFAVTLSHAVDVDTVITYSTSDGTATVADNDYLENGISSSGVEFVTETFATLTTQVRGMAFGPGGDFGNDLYVSAGSEILRVSDTGVVSTFASGLSAPTGIAFSNGGDFGTYLYVLDHGTDTIRRIDSNGLVSLFASDSEFRELDDLAFGPGTNGFSSNLFVSDGSFSGGIPGKIYEVTDSGTVSNVFGVDPLTAAGITFASGDGFGNGALILADAYSFANDDGGVRSYASDGTFSVLANAETTDLFNAADVVQAPGGRFGTDLFVSDWVTDKIYQLTADGVLSEFSTGRGFENWADADLLFAPDGNSLYVSDGADNNIIRIQAVDSLRIHAGQTTGTITVTTTDDSNVELDESLAVNLTSVIASGRDVTIADDTGVGTILNDDGTTLVEIDASGNLVITDIDGGDSDDNLSLSADTLNSQFVIYDPSLPIETSIPSASGNGTNTVYVPFAAVTGDNIVINTLGGDDVITLGSLEHGFTGLSIHTGSEFDTIQVNNNVALGSGLSLDARADTIVVNGIVSTTGAGSVSLIAERNIQLTAGSELSTVDGAITVSANAAGTGEGEFIGIKLADADVTSVNGDIQLSGQGGTQGSFLFGAHIDEASTITTSGTGNIHVSGQGGTSTGNDNIGIRADNATISAEGSGNITLNGTGGEGANFLVGIATFSDSSVTTTIGDLLIVGQGGSGPLAGTINIGTRLSQTDFRSTAGGDISILGTGGEGSSTRNHGVEFITDTTASTVGDGRITITGTAHSGSNQNMGVRLFANSEVLSENGAIEITGIGDGTGNRNYGVQLNDSQVLSTGSAPITIQGSGAADAGINNDGVRLEGSTAAVRSDTGDINIIGTGGSSIFFFNRGVLVNSGATVESINADVFITGTGNEIAIQATGILGQAVVLSAPTGAILEAVDGTDVFAETLTVNGTVSPNIGLVGSFRVDGDLEFSHSSALAVNLNGPTSHDQLQVVGVGRTVALGNATLNVVLGSAPNVGDQFVVIDNVDPETTVSGIFEGLPEGAMVVENAAGSGQDLFISYQGGTGNDVVLTTQQSVAPQISVSVDASTVNEDGADALAYTFTRTGSVDNELTVGFSVSGSAILLDDYTQSGADTFNSTAGTMTFPAGSNTVTVHIDPTTDEVTELDESVTITLDGTATRPATSYRVPAGTVGNQAWTGSMGMDFDVVDAVEITELGVFDSGSDGLNLTITAHVYDRIDPTSPVATLIFTPADPGELDGGSRFKPLSTPLSLPAGFQGSIVAEGYGYGELNGNQVLASLPLGLDSGNGMIDFVGNSRYAPFGSVGAFPTIIDRSPSQYSAGTFRFQANQAVTLGNAQSTGIISNDEIAMVSIADADVVEGGNLEFAVSLSNPVDVDTVITYSTSNGTATTDDNDYAAQVNQMLTIAAGQTSGTISVATVSDNMVEPNETVLVNLNGISSAGREVIHQDSTAVGTILNDDFPPDAPTDINTAANLISEGAIEGTLVGLTAKSTDPNDDPITYTLTNDANGRFTIDSVTGVVSVSAIGAVSLNFEDQSSHVITVQAADPGGATAQSDFTILVVNVAPAIPIDADSAENLVIEGATTGTDVGLRALSTDPLGPAVTFQLTETAGGRFTIDPLTGVIKVDDGSLLDGLATHTITVQANDGAGGTSSADFSITVANAAPSVTSVSSDATFESKSIDGMVTISGSISDAGVTDTHSLSISWGDGMQTIIPPIDPRIDQDSDTFEVSHTYLNGGIFDIEVTVIDDDGGSSPVATTDAVVVGIGMNNGVLQVVGSDANEKITIRPKSGNSNILRVRTKPQGRSATVVEVDAALVDSIHVIGCGGNDMITVASSISLPTILEGGDGNDLIFGGSGDDVIHGGAGHDKIFGRRGIDQLFGELGNDWIWGNRDGDLIDGGAGDDKLFGRLGDDQIYGGDGNDMLVGGAGDDYLNGGSGNDILWGGAGNDTLEGGDGDDFLLGGVGDDVLDGEDGDDVLFGGPGNDTLDGGNGLDLIFENWHWIWD